MSIYVKTSSGAARVSPNTVAWGNVTGKPSTFTPSSHTHNVVQDSNDGGNTTFAYSKSGLSYSDYTWLAAWNGTEMRAVNKSQYATSGHNHDSTYIIKAGSKTLKAWQAWGFVYGDGTYTYLFFPGIFVGATGTVVKPNNGIWIRAFTGTETSVYESEWSQGVQTDQGVHLGYKHSGWTTTTGFIVRSNTNTVLSAQ